MEEESKESPIDYLLREKYGITDSINAEYPLTERLRSDPDCIVAESRLLGGKPLTKREYDKMVDSVLKFNFGKVTGLKKIMNYFV